jgi:glycosyltransferase involved in cell wall biosynthesis
MKKNLLFVIPGLDAGGGEKSLVNLLDVIDAEKYNIDLILFHKGGLFLTMLPGHVNVMEIGGDYQDFSKGLLSSVMTFTFRFKWPLAVHRFLFALKNKFIKDKAVAEQQAWKNAVRSMPLPEKHYDAAIGFLEKSSVYFVVDKVNADKKIGWIHTNYASSGMRKSFDAPYFQKLDHIVTVSDECGAVLQEIFPEQKSKVTVMHNIVSADTINRLANIGNAKEIDATTTSILSIGRLSTEKGFDLAIDACAALINRGIDVKWYLVGEGKDRQILEQKIKDNQLEGKFHLLGARENPYSYLKKASIYAQTSRFEGKSIAVDEAKILYRPIVVTDFTTVKDQIEDGKNGIVTAMDPQSIAGGILKIINDKTLRDRLISNLHDEHLSTESEINTLYRLIGL